MLIVNNPDVEPTDYYILFNNVITSQNISKFLYYLHCMYKQNNYVLNVPCSNKWQYSNSGVSKLFGYLNLIFNGYEKDEYTDTNLTLNFDETDDFIIIQNE